MGLKVRMRAQVAARVKSGQHGQESGMIVRPLVIRRSDGAFVICRTAEEVAQVPLVGPVGVEVGAIARIPSKRNDKRFKNGYKEPPGPHDPYRNRPSQREAYERWKESTRRPELDGLEGYAVAMRAYGVPRETARPQRRRPMRYARPRPRIPKGASALRRRGEEIGLSEEERGFLQQVVRESSGFGVEASEARWARVVLMAAQGRPQRSIAEQLGVCRATVTNTLKRFRDGGLEALRDRRRWGEVG